MRNELDEREETSNDNKERSRRLLSVLLHDLFHADPGQ